VNLVDPRELSDRELFAYLLLGDLPRPGWPGRRRAVARRMLVVAGVTVAVIAVVLVVSIAIVLAWASMQAPA
jgi:hypothetical protein